MELPGSIKGLLKTGGRMTSGMVCAFLQTVWLHWCGGGVGEKGVILQPFQYLPWVRGHFLASLCVVRAVALSGS